MMAADLRYPSYSEALETILEAVVLPGVETVGGQDVLGRILAADLLVPRDFPDLPCSAVDGYAFGVNGQRVFTVVEEITAGHLPTRDLKTGQAAAVMTGGVLPAGADCVVRLEDCARSGNHLEILVSPEAGALINKAGSEAQEGDLLAAIGSRVDVTSQAALVCAGLAEVPVYRPPRVGIAVTGDELCEIGQRRTPGMVFNTNQYLIEGICRRLDIPFISVPVVKDDPDEIRRVLEDLCGRCDIVVTTGGVSVGSRDYVRTTLEGKDFDLLVAGTRIKPGRPMHVARRGKALVLALPGYPAAVMANAVLYLVPVLKKAGGRRNYQTTWLQAETGDPFRGRPGSLYLARASLTVEHGRWIARDTGSQMSSHFLNYARTDGLVRLPLAPPEGCARPDGSFVIPEGSMVDILYFNQELN